MNQPLNQHIFAHFSMVSMWPIRPPRSLPTAAASPQGGLAELGKLSWLQRWSPIQWTKTWLKKMGTNSCQRFSNMVTNFSVFRNPTHWILQLNWWFFLDRNPTVWGPLSSYWWRRWQYIEKSNLVISMFSVVISPISAIIGVIWSWRWLLLIANQSVLPNLLISHGWFMLNHKMMWQSEACKSKSRINHRMSWW